MTIPEPLKTDTAFERLSPILSEDYNLYLQESILKNGCTEPIDIWNGIILNGHKRYRICHETQTPFQVREHDFPSLEKAQIWTCREHFRTANLNLETGIYLIGKHFNAEKAIHFHASGGSPFKKPNYIYKTATGVGAEYDLASSTIYKYGRYAEHIDIIYDRYRTLAEYILSGKLKIAQESLAELASGPARILKTLFEFVEEKNMRQVSGAQIQELMMTGTLKDKKRAVTPTVVPTMAIKQEPEYDPDMAISSLNLTIPFWINSIRRGCEKTDFTQISRPELKMLRHLLLELDSVITDVIKNTLEEK